MNKLKYLLQNWPSGTVAVDRWLKSIGIYKELKRTYKNNLWIKTIGRGAIVKAEDKVEWPGGLYAIQGQLKSDVHIGGKTALELQGYAHYIRAQETKVFLYGSAKSRLPIWFYQYNWGVEICFCKTTFLPPEIGISTKNFGNFSLKISSPERAVLELLHYVPNQQSVEGAHLIMQGLRGLRPSLMQDLLEGSTSIKVNRLALFFGDFLNHPWFKKIDFSKINIGSGIRQITKAGHYNAKYQIYISKEIFGDEGI